MNAIRCKIISRAFTVIERKTSFVNIQKFKTASKKNKNFVCFSS